jgi:septum formation protein
LLVLTLSPRIVLASASPRRSELLRSIGVEFDVIVPDVDETPQQAETPAAMVARLADLKAQAVAGELLADTLIIAADTTVELDGASLGKPRDDGEARTFLQRLSGRTQLVHTAHALRRGDRSLLVLRSTEVRFRPLSERDISSYLATGEGRDKAGAYAIQGMGATLVDSISGCYGAVVGLSLSSLLLAARELGVELV